MLKDIKKCSCEYCAHCEPDEIDYETLDVIFWCSLHCFSTFGSSTCSEFLRG